MEHKHAALLRMAADNADQLFECDEWGEVYGKGHTITQVLFHRHFNWRPVKTTKKIKRWMWADKNGLIHHGGLFAEQFKPSGYPVKLLWSETEFEEEV